ncbi:MAG: hypothetical protein AAF605_02910 [Myxococcota bacterium]
MIVTCESVTRILEMNGVEGLGDAERAHVAQCSRCAASVRALDALNASIRRLSGVSTAHTGVLPHNPRLIAIVGASRPVGRTRALVMLVVLASAALLAAVMWQDWTRDPIDQDATPMPRDRFSSHGERTPITE